METSTGKNGEREKPVRAGWIPGLVLLFALALCFSTASAYLNTEYGFSYTPPTGWTTDESHASGELVSFKDPAGPSMISVTANRSIGINLDTFVAASQADLSTQQQVPMQFLSQKPVVVGGVNGRELLYSGSLLGIDIRDKMDFVIQADTGYVFFLTSVGGSSAENEALYDASLRTITFTTSPVQSARTPGAAPDGKAAGTSPVPVHDTAVPSSPGSPAAVAQQASPQVPTGSNPSATQTPHAPVDPAVIIFGMMISGALMLYARKK